MTEATRGNAERTLESYRSLEALAERYRGDETLRARVEAGGARSVLQEFGVAIPADVEARVTENTEDVTHIVFPPDPNAALADESLTAVSGGSGSVEASSFSTIISCAGCFRI